MRIVCTRSSSRNRFAVVVASGPSTAPGHPLTILYDRLCSGARLDFAGAPRQSRRPGVALDCRHGRPGQSRRAGRGADVDAVPAQTWTQSRRRCGRSPGADVGAVPAQMWPTGARHLGSHARVHNPAVRPRVAVPAQTPLSASRMSAPAHGSSGRDCAAMPAGAPMPQGILRQIRRHACIARD
jgi:hypothetical protein